MDVIVNGSPSIEIGFERKVVDSYKAVDSALSETSKNPVENAAITKALQASKKETDSALQSLEKSKANTTGYYPQLHVGLSDNLPDRGDVLEGFIGFRESAGAGNSIEDGTANVRELLGESLVWNQLYPTDWVQGFSTSANGVISIVGTPTENYIRFSTFEDNVQGHIYLFILETVAALNGKLFSLLNRNENVAIANGVACIFHTNTDATKQKNIGIKGLTVGEALNVTARVKQIDLTQMFSAGYEPSTVEEFEAIKNQLVGVDFNAYNKGEVLGVNIKGIKSVNDNAWDEEWEVGNVNSNNGALTNATNAIRSKNFIPVIAGETYYFGVDAAISYINVIEYDQNKNFIKAAIDGGSANSQRTLSANTAYIKFGVAGYGTTYNHDICIRLAHSGYKTDYVAHEESESSFDLTKYFPNGMHGLNGVRDSATSKKATRRYGVVDLGDLNWIYDTTYGGFVGYISGTNNHNNVFKIAWKGVCVKYPYYGVYNLVEDKGLGYIYNTNVFIKDSSYTDVASFKTAMSGVMLYHELATPIETEIDPQLNMNYKVWDFGTEELLTDSKSAPVLARTIYGFNATDTIRGNKAINEEQDARLHTLESEVVRKGDYSPDNSVGFADDLVGRGESVPAEFSFRASGGKSIKDGAARIKRLKGNSVVWNQKALFNATDETKSGISLSISDNLLHFEGANSSSGHVGFTLTPYSINLYAGNKYILLPYNVGNASYGLFVSGRYTNYLGIFSPSQDEVNRYIERRFRGEESVNETLTKPQLINLTLMFGTGNEPTTIEEFNARKPIVEDEYAYNEGEVIHMTAEGIKSVGDNAWDEEWESGMINHNTGNNINSAEHCRTVGYIEVIPNEAYFISFPPASYPSDLVVICYDANKAFIQHIGGGSANKTFTIPANCHYIRFTWVGTEYNNNIMLTLVHSGWKQDTDAGYQPYWEDRLILDQRIKDEFPDGMKSAGTAHDMAYNDMNKGVGVTETRIGVVDMGTLDWEYSAPSEGRPHGYFVCDVNGKKNGKSNLLCSRYFYANTDLTVDKSIYGITVNKTIIVVDSSYTDAASFKAAMAGVPLYYELAEPTIIEYDEPFNLDYRVADFGTEQAIAEQPSAPISADTIYQFNAVDMIREHELEIAELQSIIATMQAQLASLTNKE